MNKKLHPEDVLAVIIFASMLIITFLNVVSRYLLHLGISFSEEVVTHFAVLLSGLGAAQAVRNESHYDIPLLDGIVAPRVSYAFKLFSAFLMVVFSVYMTYAGVTMVLQQINLGKVTTMLRIPEWIWGLAIPIGCGFMAFYSVVVFIRTIKNRSAFIDQKETERAKKKEADAE